MRSYNTNSIAVLLIASMLVLFLFGGSIAKENTPAAQESARNLLKSLMAKDDPQAGPLLAQWAEYIEAASTYSNEDYMAALKALQQEYLNLVTELEQCMDNLKDPSKQYDPEWMNKLIEHFGSSFLMDKEKSILISLRMVIAGDTQNCCGSIMEKLFFKEAVLNGAYRYYFNLFIEFYKSRSPEEMKILSSRKNASENFLNLINNYSFMKMLIGDDLPRKELSEIAAKNSNEAIYNYFKENPIGCGIDAFKAMEDFRKTIQESR